MSFDLAKMQSEWFEKLLDETERELRKELHAKMFPPSPPMFKFNLKPRVREAGGLIFDDPKVMK